MRKLVLLFLLILLLVQPVCAQELTPPEAPDSVQDLMPVQTETFGQGLWKIVKDAVRILEPELAKAGAICLSLMATVLLISLLHGSSEHITRILELGAALAIGALLLRSAGSMIRLGADTVTELTEYGKLLLPVMTAALAAQGGTTSSAALYGGTVVFNTVLTSAVSEILVPAVYIYLVLSIAVSAVGEDSLKKLGEFVKWLMTWFLKIILYTFSGYMSITGVISGTADSVAVKAAKMTISGMVPVVGGILSDASETVIVSAGVMKNAVGIYGLWAIAAIWISPFVQIGVQYLLLKATGALCAAFGVKRCSELIENFSSAMGLLLAMTGTVCFLILISTVCFMKGGS